jgi:hypothetical protein
MLKKIKKMTQTVLVKNNRTEGKINTDYGINNYYKYFTKNNIDISITGKQYKDIISEFNKGLINLIIEDGLEYTIPYIGSTLCIRKDKRVPRIVNGKLYNPAPVDWVATNKLWLEDEESKSKKLLVRYLNNHTSKYVFRIYFKKYNLVFMNKKLFSFKVNRTFSRLLGKRINDEDKEKFDSYLLYNKTTINNESN